MTFFDPLPNTRCAYTYNAQEALPDDINTMPSPEALGILLNAYMASDDISAFKGTLSPQELRLIAVFEQMLIDVERNFTLSFPSNTNNEITVMVGQPPTATCLQLSDPEKQVILLNPAQEERLKELNLALTRLAKKDKSDIGLTKNLDTERDQIIEIRKQRAKGALAYYLLNEPVFASQLLKIGSSHGLLAPSIVYLQSDLMINNQHMQLIGGMDYSAGASLLKNVNGANNLQMHSTQFIFALFGAQDELWYFKNKKTQHILSSTDDVLFQQSIRNALDLQQVTRNPAELTLHYKGETLILEPLVSIQQVVSTGVQDDNVSHFETKFNIHHSDIIMQSDPDLNFAVLRDFALSGLSVRLDLPPWYQRVWFFIKDSLATIRDTIVALASAIYTRFLKKETVLPAMEVPLEAQPISQSSPSTTTLELRSSESSDNNVAPMSSAQSMLNYKTYCQKRDDRTITSNNDEIGMTVNVASQGLLTQYEYYIAPNQDEGNPGMVFKPTLITSSNQLFSFRKI